MFEKKEKEKFAEKFVEDFQKSNDNLAVFTLKKIGVLLLQNLFRFFLVIVFLIVTGYFLLFSSVKTPVISQIIYKEKIICDTFKIKLHLSQKIIEDCTKKYAAIEGVGGFYVVELTWQNRDFADSFMDEADLAVVKNDVQIKELGESGQKLLFPKNSGLYFDTQNEILKPESAKKDIAYPLYKMKREKDDKFLVTPNIIVNDFYVNVSYRFLWSDGSVESWVVGQNAIFQTVLGLQKK